MATAVAALLALAASALFAGGVVLQQEQASADTGAGATRLLRLLRRPRWVLGVAIDAVGFALQVVALHVGGLTAVQPLLVAVLLFGLPGGARTAHVRLGADAWTGAVLVSIGLAGFLLAAAPQETTDGPSRTLVRVTLGMAVAATVLVAAAPRGRGPARCVCLAFAAGLSFALVAALAAASGARFAAGGLAGLVTSWTLYGAVVAAGFGFVVSQAAYAAGPLAPALIVFTLVDPVASVALGLGVLGEHARGGIAAAAAAACATLAAGGVVLLARSDAVRAPREGSRP